MKITFKPIDADFCVDEQETIFEHLAEEGGWEAFTLGHSRRGQFYYLLRNQDGETFIYASKPDGDGGMLDITKYNLLK